MLRTIARYTSIGTSLGMCAGAFAQTESAAEKSVASGRARSTPTLDGRIDDAEWSGATIIEDFHQLEPVEFAQPSERTRVLVMHDEDHIYIAARLFDSEPDRVTASILRQGEELNDDDTFSILLDPFNDRRSGYWFETNANGVRRQALFQNGSELNFDWRGIWQAAGSRDSEGWAVEMSIPLKTLSIDPDSTTWAINFTREIERRNEAMAWVSRNQQVTPAVVGTLTGLGGLNQGVGLDIVPSVSLRQVRAFDPATTDSKLEPSLDVFYKLTPALTGALTFNTDFSATEVDEREVNLTRFDLFFPEKRTFFLQDADIFEFGRLSSTGSDSELSTSSLENGRPFFSRRIGLGDAGEPVDLRAGAKLTGRIGPLSLGVLDVQHAAHASVDSRNLFAGRAALNVLSESTLGAIVTNGDPRSDLSNTLVGVDFNYLNTRLPGDRTLQAEAWYQATDTEGLEGNDAAFGFRALLPSETGLRAGFGVKELQRNFYPALGFVNNAGIRDYTVELRYTKAMGGFLQRVLATADLQQIDLIDGGLQSRTAIYRPLVIETSSGEEFELNYVSSKEVLPEAFEISEGVILSAGEYSFDEYKVAVGTGGHRRIAGVLRAARGDFYSGERINYQGEIIWRPSPHFALIGQYEYFDVDLPEGQFITRLIQLRADVVWSSELAWSTFVQYDNVSELAGINSRVQWIPEAGRETYLVLNYGLQDFDRDDRFRSIGSDLTLKLGYTLRF